MAFQAQGDTFDKDGTCLSLAQDGRNAVLHIALMTGTKTFTFDRKELEELIEGAASVLWGIENLDQRCHGPAIHLAPDRTQKRVDLARVTAT